MDKLEKWTKLNNLDKIKNLDNMIKIGHYRQKWTKLRTNLVFMNLKIDDILRYL